MASPECQPLSVGTAGQASGVCHGATGPRDVPTYGAAGQDEATRCRAPNGLDGLDGVMSILGGILTHTVLGTIYCWSNFQTYTPSFLKNFDGHYDSDDDVDIIKLQPWSIAFEALAMPFGAKLVDAHGPQAVAILGGCLVAAGCTLASFARTLTTFAALYAGFFGTGLGIGFTPPLICGYKHFPDSKGVVSGFILAAYGGAGFVFNEVGSTIFNPHHLQADRETKLYPPSVTDSFFAHLRTLGCIYFVISMMGSSLLRLPKSAPGGSTAASAASDGALEADARSRQNVPEALRSQRFWLLWAVAACSSLGVLHVATSWKSIALRHDVLRNDNYLANVGAMGSLSTAVVRPFWGMLYDRFGFHRCMSFITACQTMLFLGHDVFFLGPRTFCASFMGSYALLGGVMTIMPSETYACFGNAAIYGMIFSAYAISATVGVNVATVIADAVLVEDPAKPSYSMEKVLPVFAYFSAAAFLAVQCYPVRKAELSSLTGAQVQGSGSCEEA